jgi:hypothetical protein
MAGGGGDQTIRWRASLILYKSVLGIRNWIRMFLGLPDPDPLVRGTVLNLAPDPSHKCVERTEILPTNKILTKNFRKFKFNFLD